jgi:hypothetical protein
MFNMKKFAIACAVAVLGFSLANSVSAGEISKSNLGSMGLGSMQSISDNEGLLVRGKGTTATVWGISSARYFGASSSNGYFASSHHHRGSALAVGANASVAGGLSFRGLAIVGAGGASFAFAR